MQVKNPELITTSEEMKNARLNLLVEFDDDTQVNLEMQATSTTDSIPFRAQYYLARVHAEQDMRGNYTSTSSQRSYFSSVTLQSIRVLPLRTTFSIA